MKSLGIIIFIGCLLLPNLARAEESLPRDLIAYMNSLDIKYRPFDKSDLSVEIQDFIFHAEPEVQITNDFDGDNRDDYALLVNSRDTYVSIIVFLRRGDSFEHQVIKDFNYGRYYDERNIKVIMIPMPKSIEGISGVLELKNGGIYVSCAWCSTGSVYYWNNGNFDRFPISD
jgi:hypothetical protein